MQEGWRSKLKSGGWCYRQDVFSASKAEKQRDWMHRPIRVDARGFRIIALPQNQSYLLPAHHFPADARFLEALHHLSTRHLRRQNDLQCARHRSGRGIRARTACTNGLTRYHGVDGAGDVEEMTASFVHFADLTQENLAAKACWVVSFAVAEHVRARLSRVRAQPPYARMPWHCAPLGPTWVSGRGTSTLARMHTCGSCGPRLLLGWWSRAFVDLVSGPANAAEFGGGT